MDIKRWNGEVLKKRELIYMATQLAPTPILYGVEAKNVLNELNRKTSKESIIKGNKLIDFFKKLEEK
ncbi:hypothetical protein [Clostridium sardiniense]|uniref:hypothetical protein n=1 Tax=Clostridium sardiniense TaxID=29369 RepID=UPI001959B989|nr:hypothetical protein [Clostridium sardiniense]MBM7835732.1 hypothetical protein [Clostridium sardiniense]